MADSEKSVRDRLLTHAGVSNIVGVGKRVWYSRLPHDPALPAITVQEISGVPAGAMGNDTGHVQGRMQVDAWAENRADAKTLGEQVRDALQRYNGTHATSDIVSVDMNSGGVRYEPESKIWRHRQDFELWWTESV